VRQVVVVMMMMMMMVMMMTTTIMTVADADAAMGVFLSSAGYTNTVFVPVSRT